jgi:hypothetical protein
VIILDNNSIIKSNDKFIKESQISFFKLQEDHNPLDIPFGHEVKEKNMNVKDVSGPDDVDEGGMGSGRNPEGGGDSGSAPGPLISFGLNETIAKQLMDAKLKESCKCRKKN